MVTGRIACSLSNKLVRNRSPSVRRTPQFCSEETSQITGLTGSRGTRTQICRCSLGFATSTAILLSVFHLSMIYLPCLLFVPSGVHTFTSSIERKICSWLREFSGRASFRRRRSQDRNPIITESSPPHYDHRELPSDKGI